MAQPWDAEREVSLDEVRRAARGGGLEAAAVEVVGIGWDNTVVRVDDAWVLRFPRRSIALPGVQREMDLLPRLADRLPLPVPVPELRGTFGDPPWPFWGSRFLPGTELARRRGDRVRVASQVGSFLRALHALPHEPGLLVDPMVRADATLRAAKTRATLDELEDAGMYDGDACVDALLGEASRADRPDHQAVLSHGDLYARHVLVDADGSATAVIDWGDLCLAPRSVDLNIAFSAFTDNARVAFFAAYGPIDRVTELRARVLAMNLAAAVAQYAHDVGDDELLTESLAGVARAAR
jgi:aminoglycoside phosphotransferase (APT) family kinase protein